MRADKPNRVEEVTASIKRWGPSTCRQLEQRLGYPRGCLYQLLYRKKRIFKKGRKDGASIYWQLVTPDQ